MTAAQEDAMKTSAVNRAFGTTDRLAKYGLDPFQAIIGRPGRLADASGIAAQGAAGYQNQFDPFNQQIAGGLAANRQNVLSTNIADYNAKMSLWGAGLSAFGDIAGAVIPGIPDMVDAFTKPKP